LLSEEKLCIFAIGTVFEQTQHQFAFNSRQEFVDYIFEQKKSQVQIHSRISFGIKKEQTQDETFGLENLSMSCNSTQVASGSGAQRFTRLQHQSMLFSTLTQTSTIRAGIDSDNVIHACTVLLAAYNRVAINPRRSVESNAAKAIIMRVITYSEVVSSLTNANQSQQTLAIELNHLVDLIEQSEEESQSELRDYFTKSSISGVGIDNISNKCITENKLNEREVAEDIKGVTVLNERVVENKSNERDISRNRYRVVVEKKESTREREILVEEDDWFNDLI